MPNSAPAVPHASGIRLTEELFGSSRSVESLSELDRKLAQLDRADKAKRAADAELEAALLALGMPADRIGSMLRGGK